MNTITLSLDIIIHGRPLISDFVNTLAQWGTYYLLIADFLLHKI